MLKQSIKNIWVSLHMGMSYNSFVSSSLKLRRCAMSILNECPSNNIMGHFTLQRLYNLCGSLLLCFFPTGSAHLMKYFPHSKRHEPNDYIESKDL